ncbi:lipase member H-like [Agrilus planipennis]|uniref:Lipase member H-like n=1 Tax=Agrilus planipennis TaxID=224129 RepID=A0A7F5RK38_AGRPL|nr:lipase member H-like [Agrilus planipennis]
MFNTTLKNCSWRPTANNFECPEGDVSYYLYSGGKKEQVPNNIADWLKGSIWNPYLDNVFIIHGYAGGDNTLPIVVLRDAYINNGSFNVWMIDWFKLSQPPCYASAVHNIKFIARCSSNLLMSLRSSGLRSETITCVGHSLGAHICGLISRNILFRMHRIVALDPARPLVPRSQRLSSSDASAVHVLHTNAGDYGELGRSGHVDFCINGGRTQSFCESTSSASLCSHIWSVCYMAESINPQTAKRAEPCVRRCPSGPISVHRVGFPILMGQHTPLSASGSYCVESKNPPFCPTGRNMPGDPRCCLSDYIGDD